MSSQEDNFLARANAAVAAATAAQQMNTPTSRDERIAQMLAQDRPTIESAVKAFMSLVAARTLAQSSTERTVLKSSQEALVCARLLLRTINQYVFPIQQETSDPRRAVVAQIWNGLVAGSQKPCRVLGRKALLFAWDDLEFDYPTAVENSASFVKEFGDLLKSDRLDLDVDNDANLLWDADGGQSELERRRQRRKQRANRQPIVEEEEEGEDEEETQLQAPDELLN